MKELKKRVLSIALAITMVLGMVLIPSGKASTVKAAANETRTWHIGESGTIKSQDNWFNWGSWNNRFTWSCTDESILGLSGEKSKLFDGKLGAKTFYVDATAKKGGTASVTLLQETWEDRGSWKKTGWGIRYYAPHLCWGEKARYTVEINVVKADATVEANGPQGWTYDGTAHYATLNPSDYIKNTDGTVTGVLKDSNNTAIDPKNMINAGNYTYTVSSAATDYTNGASRTYSINVVQKTITSKDVTVKDLVYNGSDKSVVVTDGTKTLTEGTDYTVSYTGDRKNVTESGFSAVVTGINNYKGTVTLENQKITAKDVDVADANAVITYSKTRDWTGEDVKADVAITVNGTTLVEGTDYEVDYAADADLKDIKEVKGSVNATVKFLGNYKGADKEISYDITATPVLIAVLKPGQVAPTDSKTFGSWHYENLGTAYIKNNSKAINELKTGKEETAATAVENQMLPFTPYPYSQYYKDGKGATLYNDRMIKFLGYTDKEIEKYGISIDWFRIQHEPGDGSGLNWHVDGRLVYSKPITVNFVKSIDGKVEGDVIKTVSAKYLSTVDYTDSTKISGLTFKEFTTTNGTINTDKNDNTKCSLTGFSKDTTVYLNYTTDKHTVTYVDGVTGKTVNTVTGATYAAGTAFTGKTDKTGYTFKDFTVKGDATVDPKTGALTKVNSDATVTINYTENKYSVKYVAYITDDDKATVVSEQEIAYTGSATVPEAPKWEGHTFTGWSTDNKIDQNDPKAKEIVAKYDVNTYNVKFMDGDTQVGDTQVIPYEGSATAPTAPNHDAEVFDHWDADYSKITGDLTVNAVYVPKTFTVKFVDDNAAETVLDTKTVKYGETATSTVTPNRIGYTFTKFGDATNVQSDLTVKAIYTENNYTVTFVDYDGTVISTQSVPYTGAAKVPADPTRAGYNFSGWNTQNYIIDSNAPADRVITATYTAIVAPVNPVLPTPANNQPGTVVAPAAVTNPIPAIAMPANGAATTVPNRRTAATPAQQNTNTAAVANNNNNDTTTDTTETINDDKTPLASNSKSEKISDNKTPKGVTKDTCYIHWIMLILTALFGIYNIVRVVKGNKEESEEKSNR